MYFYLFLSTRLKCFVESAYVCTHEKSCMYAYMFFVYSWLMRTVHAHETLNNRMPVNLCFLFLLYSGRLFKQSWLIADVQVNSLFALPDKKIELNEFCVDGLEGIHLYAETGRKFVHTIRNIFYLPCKPSYHRCQFSTCS